VRLWTTCVGCALRCAMCSHLLPRVRALGMDVLWWAFLRSNYVRVASSSVMAELATFLALVWKTRVENFLSN
jgi:hypothetical protein